MNTSRLAGMDSHLNGLDNGLEDIDTTFGEVNETVNNLKLDVHALDTAKEDDAKNANRRQARSSSMASHAQADRSDFPRFSGYMGTRPRAYGAVGFCQGMILPRCSHCWWKLYQFLRRCHPKHSRWHINSS
jgi:hypothetical protein